MTPRAKSLPPDERRAAIIAAARPLVAQHGPAVTTAQIAEAAGIAEGTLFRVFASKAEIVVAAIRSTTDASPLIDFVTAQDQPTLGATSRAILGEMVERYRQVSRMYATLYSLGQEGQDAAKPMHGDFHTMHEQQVRLHDAIRDALATHADELRIEPDKAASLLMGFATISSHGLVADGNLTDLDELLDLFLHGAALPDRTTATKHKDA